MYWFRLLVLLSVQTSIKCPTVTMYWEYFYNNFELVKAVGPFEFCLNNEGKKTLPHSVTLIFEGTLIFSLFIL